jgi:hypothetical protein
MMLNKVFGAIESVPYENQDQHDLVRGLVDVSIHRLRNINKAAQDIARNEYFSGLDESFEYDKMNALLNSKIVEYCAASSGMSLEATKGPMARNSTIFKEKLFQIVSLALPTVISAVTQYAFAQFADVRNVGWGDTAHFSIKSREISTVNTTNKAARRGGIQRTYQSDMTIVPTSREMTVALDWYLFITGRMDMGDWMVRIALGFSTDINYRIYKQIDDAYGSLNAAFKAGSFTDVNWLTMTEKISAANGGLPVTAFGMLSALGYVIPSNDYLKMQLGSTIAEVGYLGRYKGTNLVQIPATLKPGTVDDAGAFTFLTDATRIYFFSLDAEKPVKIVFEGTPLSINESAESRADKQMLMSIAQCYEAKIATASVFGIMDVA